MIWVEIWVTLVTSFFKNHYAGFGDIVGNVIPLQLSVLLRYLAVVSDHSQTIGVVF